VVDVEVFMIEKSHTLDSSREGARLREKGRLRFERDHNGARTRTRTRTKTRTGDGRRETGDEFNPFGVPSRNRSSRLS
jgi:hypothetical protein